jgi:glycosyltransferase involved in cell wall biosynthesis
MSSCSFAVVICTYTERRWHDLVAAVESVRRQALPTRRTVVVVDGDPALDERVRADLPDVTAVLKRGGRGLSAARNAGVAATAEDVVAFLDDDAVAHPSWLARLAEHYADPDVLGVGGAVEPRFAAGRPAWFPREFDWVVGCSYRGLPQELSPVRNFIGANMSFRSEVFDAVGGFDGAVGRVGASPTGCDETEFCIRIRERLLRGKLLYEPRAVVRHRVPEFRARWHYFWRRCWAEGRSKAVVARTHPRTRALSTERTYTLEVLPGAFARALAEAAARRDHAALVRAGAIAGGLTVTTAGYVAGTRRSGRGDA